MTRRLLFMLFVLSCAPSMAQAETGHLVVRILDGQTGHELPARLVLETSDGKFPGDRLACSADRWPNIAAHGVFIDGHAEFDVPEGKTLLTAAHGFQYGLASKNVDVKPG